MSVAMDVNPATAPLRQRQHLAGRDGACLPFVKRQAPAELRIVVKAFNFPFENRSRPIANTRPIAECLAGKARKLGWRSRPLHVGVGERVLQRDRSRLTRPASEPSRLSYPTTLLLDGSPYPAKVTPGCLGNTVARLERTPSLRRPASRDLSGASTRRRGRSSLA